MLRATIHLDLHEDFVLSAVSRLAIGPIVVTQCEVLDDENIRFVIDAGERREEMAALLTASDAVADLERVGDDQLLITKRSSGAVPIIRENHGMLQRMSQFHGTSRVFDVVVFRREDLKAIIGELRSLGHVSLTKLKPFAAPSTPLSSRQAEVVGLAFEAGYFDWPRRTDAETLATRLGISHSTFLEHLRKAEKKLLADALAETTTTAAPDSLA